VNTGFGLANSLLELKIFIMFILRAVGTPTSFEPLYDLVIRDGSPSYFDFVECLNGLIKTGHVALKDGKYQLTDRGGENIAITEKNLPYSLRLKGERNTRAYRAAASRDAMIRASHTIRRSGGYTVELSLSDGGGDVISLRVFAASEREAILLEEGFRERAEASYNKIINFILEPDS
jgi:hypothetical protein